MHNLISTVVINNLYKVPCNFKSNTHTLYIQDPKIAITSIDIFIVFDISRLFFGGSNDLKKFDSNQKQIIISLPRS